MAWFTDCRLLRFTILVRMPSRDPVAVARELNERPHQTSNVSTPAEILNGALTG